MCNNINVGIFGILIMAAQAVVRDITTLKLAFNKLLPLILDRMGRRYKLDRA